MIKEAVETLEEYDRVTHNTDIVDGIWGRIQNSELHQFAYILKVQNQLHPIFFKEILQKRASQVSNLIYASTGFRRNLLDIKAIY